MAEKPPQGLLLFSSSYLLFLSLCSLHCIPTAHLLFLNHARIQTGLEAFSLVQFSHSVMSDSLQPHDSQHARPPYPLPTPGVYSNSSSSSWWCHLGISSSVIPFSSCPQSLPASGSFPMSQLFTWGGQSIGVSASTSVLPMNTQDCQVGIIILSYKWRN